MTQRYVSIIQKYRIFWCLIIWLLTSSIIFPQQFSGGSGTEGNPWLISSQIDFDSLRYVSDINNYFEITGQIYMADEEYIPWIPIGSHSNPWKGHIEGNNNLIVIGLIDSVSIVSGYDGSTTYYHAGLFARIDSSSIVNLRLQYTEGIEIGRNGSGRVQLINSANFRVGHIAGRAQHNVFSNISIISSGISVYTQHLFTTFPNGELGGFIGYSSHNNISQCSINADSFYVWVDRVSGGSGVASPDIGGLLGSTETDTVDQCYIKYNLSYGRGEGKSNFAGFVYQHYGDPLITNCYSIIDTMIADCSFPGSSTRNYYGFSASPSTGSIISKCYSYVKIDTTGLSTYYSDGDARLFASDGSFANVFFSYTDSSYGFSDLSANLRSSIDMKTESNYLTWDFDSTWIIGTPLSDSFNDGYPVLLYQVGKSDYFEFVDILRNSTGELFPVVPIGDTLGIGWDTDADIIMLGSLTDTNIMSVYPYDGAYIFNPDSSYVSGDSIVIVGRGLRKTLSNIGIYSREIGDVTPIQDMGTTSNIYNAQDLDSLSYVTREDIRLKNDIDMAIFGDYYEYRKATSEKWDINKIIKDLPVLKGDLNGENHTIRNWTVNITSDQSYIEDNMSRSGIRLFETRDASGYLYDITFENCTLKVDLEKVDDDCEIALLPRFYGGDNVRFRNCVIDVNIDTLYYGALAVNFVGTQFFFGDAKWYDVGFEGCTIRVNIGFAYPTRRQFYPNLLGYIGSEFGDGYIVGSYLDDNCKFVVNLGEIYDDWDFVSLSSEIFIAPLSAKIDKVIDCYVGGTDSITVHPDWFNMLPPDYLYIGLIYADRIPIPANNKFTPPEGAKRIIYNGSFYSTSISDTFYNFMAPGITFDEYLSYGSFDPVGPVDGRFDSSKIFSSMGADTVYYDNPGTKVVDTAYYSYITGGLNSVDYLNKESYKVWSGRGNNNIDLYNDWEWKAGYWRWDNSSGPRIRGMNVPDGDIIGIDSLWEYNLTDAIIIGIDTLAYDIGQDSTFNNSYMEFIDDEYIEGNELNDWGNLIKLIWRFHNVDSCELYWAHLASYDTVTYPYINDFVIALQDTVEPFPFSKEDSLIMFQHYQYIKGLNRPRLINDAIDLRISLKYTTEECDTFPSPGCDTLWILDEPSYWDTITYYWDISENPGILPEYPLVFIAKQLMIDGTNLPQVKTVSGYMLPTNENCQKWAYNQSGYTIAWKWIKDVTCGWADIGEGAVKGYGTFNVWPVGVDSIASSLDRISSNVRLNKECKPPFVTGYNLDWDSYLCNPERVFDLEESVRVNGRIYTLVNSGNDVKLRAYDPRWDISVTVANIYPGLGNTISIFGFAEASSSVAWILPRGDSFPPVLTAFRAIPPLPGPDDIPATAIWVLGSTFEEGEDVIESEEPFSYYGAIRTNKFRGIHPKIWKFGNPDGRE